MFDVYNHTVCSLKLQFYHRRKSNSEPEIESLLEIPLSSFFELSIDLLIELEEPEGHPEFNKSTNNALDFFLLSDQGNEI